MTLIWLGCGGCHWDGFLGKSAADKIQASGELVVLTRNAPTTYYLAGDTYTGIEYELAQSFAAFLGVKARFLVLETTADILRAIQNNEGHIAAAGLTRTAERQRFLTFGPDYQMVRQEVVCHRRGKCPRGVEDLFDLSVLVIAGSSYEERLEELREELPELAWSATTEMETEQILQKISRRELDCTIADSNIVSINRRYFPALDVAFALGEEEPLAWVLAPNSTDLTNVLAEWFASMDESGELERLLQRFYGHVEVFDYVDYRSYLRRVQKRLPTYRPYFTKAAKQYGLSWTMLAAQAYQESHWDPLAQSPTGVRGLMMLTNDTAEHLGVSDRLSPEQSIMGGARYLRQMYRRLPKEIIEPDRTWIALAAYNIGYGHISDAFILARRENLNPYIWSDLRQVLPLLSQRKHYKTLPNGYARGNEPVRYVQRIRDYQDILERYLGNQLLAKSK